MSRPAMTIDEVREYHELKAKLDLAPTSIKDLDRFNYLEEKAQALRIRIHDLVN